MALKAFAQRATELNTRLKETRKRMEESTDPKLKADMENLIVAMQDELETVEKMNRALEKQTKQKGAFLQVAEDGTAGMSLSRLTNASRNAQAIIRGVNPADENALEDMERAIEVQNKAMQAAASLKHGFTDAMSVVRDDIDTMGVPALTRLEAAFVEMLKYANNDKEYADISEKLAQVRIALADAKKGYNDALLNPGKYSSDEINAFIADLQRLSQQEGVSAKDADELRAHIEMFRNELAGRVQKNVETVLGGDLSEFSTAEIREAVKQARELQSSLDTGGTEFEDYSKMIVKAEDHLKKFSVESVRAAQAVVEQRDMMSARMENLSSLSQSSLQETLKYWEAQRDAVERNSTEFETYEQHIEKIRLHQEMMAEEQKHERGFSLTEAVNAGQLDTTTIAKARDALAQLKEYRDALKLTGEEEQIAKVDAAMNRLSGNIAKVAEGYMEVADAQKIGEQVQDGTFSGTIADLERAKKALTEFRRTIELTGKGERELAKVDAAIEAIEQQTKGCYITTKKFAEILAEPKGKSFDELQAAIKRAEEQLNAMPRATKEEQEAFAELKGRIEAAKEELKDFGEAQDDAGISMDGLKEKAKQLAAAYLGLQAFKEVWGANVEMSDSMADVRKTTGMTAEEVDNLTRSIKDIDSRTANEQLMALAATAGQVGLSTHEQVYGFVTAANQITTSLDELGTDGVLQLMKVAQVSGALDDELGDVETTLLKVGSSINELSAASSATAGPITDFIGRVGGVASTARIAMADIAALGATTDQLAISSELAGTQMNLFINGMQRHTDIVSNVIGQSQEWVMQMMEQGRTMEVLVSLLEKMRGMNAVELYDFLKDMGSSGSRATQVFSTLSQNVDALRANIATSNQAYREGISITNEYNTRNESAAGLVARLKNELQETFVRPEIINAIRAMASAAKTFLEVWMNPYVAPAMNAITVFLASSLLGVNKLSVAVANLRTKIAQAGSVAKGFAVAWKSFFAANWPAIILAIGTAIVTAVMEMYNKFKEARRELGEFTKGINKQREAVDKLFKPLKDTNTQLEERRKLIDQINGQYSRYLGYMLSETTSAQQLAEAHRQVVLQLKAEALQKKILDKTNEVTGEHEDELNERYGALVQKGAKSVRNGNDVDDVMGEIKAFIDQNAEKFTGIDLGTTMTRSEGGKMLNEFLRGMVKQGKIAESGLGTLMAYGADYAREMRSTVEDVKNETRIYETDLRMTQANIRKQSEQTLSSLISNIANFTEEQTRKSGSGPLLPQPKPQGTSTQQLQSTWQKGTQKDKGNTWTQQPTVSPAVPSNMPDIEKMTAEQARQFLTYQDQLRSYVETNSERLTESERETAKTYLVTKEQIVQIREKAGLPATDESSETPTPTSGGEGGSIDSRSTEYLKKRKKELQKMADLLEDGFDVTLLHYDKEFEKSGAETVDAAREWFNSQMQQIQAVLDARRKAAKPDKVTDPDKVEAKSERERRRRYKDQIRGATSAIDSEAADAEEMVKEQRAAGIIGDGEMNRRIERIQMEHYARLRQMYQLFLGDIDKLTEAQQTDILTAIGIDDESVEDTRKRVEGITTWLKGKGADVAQSLELKANVAGVKVQDAVIKHQQRLQAALESGSENIKEVVFSLRDTLDDLDLLFGEGDSEDNRGEDAMRRRVNLLARYADDAVNISAEELRRRMEQDEAFGDWIVNRTDTDFKVLLEKLRKFHADRLNAIKKDAEEQRKAAEVKYNNSTQGQQSQQNVTNAQKRAKSVSSGPLDTGDFGTLDRQNAELDVFDAEIARKRELIAVTRELMDTRLAELQAELDASQQRIEAQRVEVENFQEGTQLRMEAETLLQQLIDEKNIKQQEYDAQIQVSTEAVREQQTQLDELYMQRMEKQNEVIGTQYSMINGYVENLNTFADSFGQALYGSKEDRQAAGKQLLKDVATTSKKLIQQWLTNLIMKKFFNQQEVQADETAAAQSLAVKGAKDIGELSSTAAKTEGQVVAGSAGAMAQEVGSKGWIGIAIGAAIGVMLTALLGVVLGKINKAKSEVAAATGAASAGKMATGMLTYASGNVDTVTGGDVRKGESYTVDGADGQTYRARYEGDKMKTGVYRGGAHFGIFSEKQPELIVDGRTTQRLMLNYPGIIDAIKTISRGGSLAPVGMQRGGMRTFADGNMDDVLDGLAGDTQATGGDAALQTELSALREVVGQLSSTLAAGIKATTSINILGPDGLDEKMEKASRYKKRNGLG